jgi:hypothetical protein
MARSRIRVRRPRRPVWEHLSPPGKATAVGACRPQGAPTLDSYRPRSRQYGRASAPMMPQRVHTMRVGTGTSSGHGSALMTLQFIFVTARIVLQSHLGRTWRSFFMWFAISSWVIVASLLVLRAPLPYHGTHFTASAPLYSPYGDQNPVSPAPTSSPNTAARF